MIQRPERRAQRRVLAQPRPRLLEAIGHPGGDVRLPTGQVGLEGTLESAEGFLGQALNKIVLEQLGLERLHPRGQRRVLAQAAWQVGEGLLDLAAERVIGIARDLAQPRVQRPHDPLAVDDAEEVGEAEQHPRVDADALAVALEQIVDDVRDGGAERRAGPGRRSRPRPAP